MPLILNIETATTVCSVALAKDGELIALKELNNGYTHAENLTVFIREIFKEQQNFNLNDIDAIAVSRGPGSYTGLRIGVSTAKGLCYALNKPLIAIDTLRIMAEAEPVRKSFSPSPPSTSLRTGLEIARPELVKGAGVMLCPMLDARRMEVYCALYDINGKEILPVSAVIVDEIFLSEQLQKNKIIFFGDGSGKCKSFFADQPNAIFIDNIFPSAKSMISLSEEAFSKKRFENTAYFEPFYLKDFVSGSVKA